MLPDNCPSIKEREALRIINPQIIPCETLTVPCAKPINEIIKGYLKYNIYIYIYEYTRFPSQLK